MLLKMLASLIFVFTISSLTFARVDAQNIANTSRDQRANYCLLPPYPEHGRYTFSNDPSARPGQRYPSVKLDVSCDPGYKIENTINSIFCFNGEWSASMPTCVSDIQGFCILPTDDLRVEYRCASTPGSLESSQECESFVSSGAVVTPICRSPAYFSLRPLSKMHCRDGIWDYNPICQPACGVTTQHRQLEGTSINHVQLPWHAVIYRRNSNLPTCGGSLITATKIISGALCFYDFNLINDVPHPVNDFGVAVNKMYYQYNDPRDKNSQHSDVVDIKIPSNYRGRTAHFENDIAIVVVKTPFFFHLSVRPVCLDFDNNLDRIQLSEGKYGKTVHWHYDNHQLSQVLNVVDFPYMKNENCDLPPEFRQYLTKDKFCSRFRNGTWNYQNVAGAGFAFLESTTQRYYLRGVVSYGRSDLDTYISHSTWPYTGNISSGLVFLESTTQRYYLRGVLSVYHTVTEDNTTIYPYTSILFYKF